MNNPAGTETTRPPDSYDTDITPAPRYENMCGKRVLSDLRQIKDTTVINSMNDELVTAYTRNTG